MPDNEHVSRVVAGFVVVMIAFVAAIAIRGAFVYVIVDKPITSDANVISVLFAVVVFGVGFLYVVGFAVREYDTYVERWK